MKYNPYKLAHSLVPKRCTPSSAWRPLSFWQQATKTSPSPSSPTSVTVGGMNYFAWLKRSNIILVSICFLDFIDCMNLAVKFVLK